MVATGSSIVDLGFVTARVPVGAHVCQVYLEDDERDESITKFLLCGLKDNEATAFFSDRLSPSMLRTRLELQGLSLEQELNSRRLFHSGAEAMYFEGQRFDPERMLRMLAEFHSRSVADHRAGARIIGEMSPRIGQIEGGTRLLEYESRVNCVLRGHPLTVVCQYNAHAFDGATIMDVMTVHPLLVVRGCVVQNPFYVPPEEYLRS
jgi:hypothetical protein